MDTRDFLLIFAKRAGSRTMGLLINGWRYKTYMRLAALTSYIKFECGFDNDGFCKNKQQGGDYPKRNMCCCSGCHFDIGFIYQLPADFQVIEEYAKSFNNKTGFWRKGVGCTLPRSHRSPTCLTHNCDHPNVCRPDSHKHLLQCLLYNKRSNMIIDGERSTEYYLPGDLRRWLERPPTYNTAQGSIDYGS